MRSPDSYIAPKAENSQKKDVVLPNCQNNIDPLDFCIAPRATGSQIKDVVLLDCQNITGRVIVFGDIHGAATFSDLEPLMTPENKIIFVGDFMDRGSESHKNMMKIIEKKENIAAVRGNHEEMFLLYLQARTKKEKEGEKSLNNKENKYIANYLLKRNGGDWAAEKTLEELEKIKDYIETLPYILQVALPGDKKFLVCHADMNFLNDAEIAEKLSGNGVLTKLEKAHATWARNDGTEVDLNQCQAKRNNQSITVYCGHSKTTTEGTEVVRSHTAHINLDFGSYEGAPLIGAEHAAGKAIVRGLFDKKYPKSKINPFLDQLFCLHQHMGDIEFTRKETKKIYEAHLKSPHFLSSKNQDFTAISFRPQTNLSDVNFDQCFINLSTLNIAQLKSAKWDYIYFYDSNDGSVTHLSRNNPLLNSCTTIKALVEAVKKEKGFANDFIVAVTQDTRYQQATQDRKFALLRIANNKIIAEYDLKPEEQKTSPVQDILDTAMDRVLTIEKFPSYYDEKNKKSFTTSSKKQFDYIKTAAEAKCIEEKNPLFVSKMNGKIEKWSASASKTNAASSAEIENQHLKNLYVIAAFRVSINKATKTPTFYKNKLASLINRLDEKRAEYKIRLAYQYKKEETERKQQEAESINQYLIKMHNVLFDNPSAPPLIKFINFNSEINKIPSRPQHTFNSELIAIYDDMKKMMRAQIQAELKNDTTSKLKSTFANLTICNMQYQERVASKNNYIGFFSCGINAEDKLIATRDLIQLCIQLAERLQNKDKTPFKMVFSSEKANKAARQGALKKEFQAICDVALGAELEIELTHANQNILAV